MMNRLNQIVERTGCKIVVSSTWRLRPQRQVYKHLQDKGLKGIVLPEAEQYPPYLDSVVIGSTPTPKVVLGA